MPPRKSNISQATATDNDGGTPVKDRDGTNIEVQHRSIVPLIRVFPPPPGNVQAMLGHPIPTRSHRSPKGLPQAVPVRARPVSRREMQTGRLSPYPSYQGYAPPNHTPLYSPLPPPPEYIIADPTPQEKQGRACALAARNVELGFFKPFSLRLETTPELVLPTLQTPKLRYRKLLPSKLQAPASRTPRIYRMWIQTLTTYPYRTSLSHAPWSSALRKVSFSLIHP